jgi:hypothetical protein
MENMTATAMIQELRKVLKRLHYSLEVMLVRPLVCSLPLELSSLGGNDAGARCLCRSL